MLPAQLRPRRCLALALVLALAHALNLALALVLVFALTLALALALALALNLALALALSLALALALALAPSLRAPILCLTWVKTCPLLKQSHACTAMILSALQCSMSASLCPAMFNISSPLPCNVQCQHPSALPQNSALQYKGPFPCSYRPVENHTPLVPG